MLCVLFSMFVISLLILSTPSEAVRPFLDIELHNAGFHRDLLYSLKFVAISKDDCNYYLEQKFPAGVYVNTDELDDLRRLSKLLAVYPSHIDVEIPTEKATEFFVYFFGAASNYQSFTFPIHYRYNQAKEKKPFEKVIIEYPKMYLRCSTTSKEHQFDKEVDIFCFNGTNINLKAEDETDCGWKLTEYDSTLHRNLVANIPIGDKTIYSFIFYLTIAVSWCGCICILFALNRKYAQIQKKLID